VALPKGESIKVNGVDMNAEQYPKVEDKEQTALYRFASGSFTIEIE
jgi:hypothetical protein